MFVVQEAGIGFRVWTTTWGGHSFRDSSEMLVHPVPSLGRRRVQTWPPWPCKWAARGGSIRSILLLASWYGGRGGSIRSTRETHFFFCRTRSVESHWSRRLTTNNNYKRMGTAAPAHEWRDCALRRDPPVRAHPAEHHRRTAVVVPVGYQGQEWAQAWRANARHVCSAHPCP
jgi:hypothetical protein